MAFKEYNTDIGVQGKISLTTVPNKAGTLLTYGSEGDISTRTNTQIISDLGLISATNIASSYYTKIQLQTSGQSQVHWGNIISKPNTLEGYGITDAHKVDRTGGLINVSDSHRNQSWFDYNWANTGRKGSVISFGGLNDLYNTEFFGMYNNDGNEFAVRTRNGDTNVWNPRRWLWHSGNFNPVNYVTTDTSQIITAYKTFGDVTLGNTEIEGIINLNRQTGPNTGISWWLHSATAWRTYMATAGVNEGPVGINAPAGQLVTSYALRNNIEDYAGYGWIFESGDGDSTTPTVKAEIRSSDGAARFGSVSVYGGLASGFLKANGTIDSNEYIPTSGGSFIDANGNILNIGATGIQINVAGQEMSISNKSIRYGNSLSTFNLIRVSDDASYISIGAKDGPQFNWKKLVLSFKEGISASRTLLMNDAGELCSVSGLPMLTTHVANAITSANITNWNTAFGWGNHATAGYLTSSALSPYAQTSWVNANFDKYTAWNLQTNNVQRTSIPSGSNLNLVAGANVTINYSAGGTVTINAVNTDTNTTYVAGDGISITGANNVITNTKPNVVQTLSGSGNTITLRGGGSYTIPTQTLLPSNPELTYGASGLNYFNISGVSGNNPILNQAPTDSWHHIIRMNHSNAGGYYADLAISMVDNSGISRRVISNGTALSDWVKLWDSTHFTQDNINNWNTAFNWGNHVGRYATINHSHSFASITDKPATYPPDPHTHSQYLTQETDPTVPTHVKSISTGNIAEWNESFKRRATFTSNIDANDKSFLSGYYSIETANGTGNTNFPSNSAYGVFSRMSSNSFTTDMFYYNEGAMAFRTWYNSGVLSNWRVVWDNVNLTKLSQLSNDSGYLTSSALSSYAQTSWVNTNFIPKSHPVYNVTTANINDWNTAVSWGNHAGLYSSRALVGATENSIRAADTRNSNPLPSTDLKFGTWFDFKSASVLGIPSNHEWAGVMTLVPYGDDSGNNNAAFRLAQSNNKLFFQNYIGGAWRTWNELWHSGNFNPNGKANAWENATGIGLASAQNPNADNTYYPYFSSTYGYIPLATRKWVGDNFDKYNYWNLQTNNVQRTSMPSGSNLNLVAGANVTISYSAGGTVTINAANSGVPTNMVTTDTTQTIEGSKTFNNIINFKNNIIGYFSNGSKSHQILIQDSIDRADLYITNKTGNGVIRLSALATTTVFQVISPTNGEIMSIGDGAGYAGFQIPNATARVRLGRFADYLTQYMFIVNGNSLFENTILCNSSITASSFYESSLREFKTNIKPYEKSGLELINDLEIVTFDRKDESVKNKIGIIADDSPKEFLSEELDAVDLYKTVFIQAKAIQELTEEVNNLRELLMSKLNQI